MSSTVFEDQENRTVNFKGEIMCPGGERKPLVVINQVTMSTTVEAVDVTSTDNFAGVLKTNVNISHVRTAKPRIASLVERNPTFGHVQSTKGKMVGVKRWPSGGTLITGRPSIL